METYDFFCAHSNFQSGSSGCFKSHKGRRLRTSGILSKLYSGGGEVVAHSSVHASHGSSPASLPFDVGIDQVDDKKRTPAPWKKTADGRDLVPNLPTASRLIRVKSAAAFRGSLQSAADRKSGEIQ